MISQRLLAIVLTAFVIVCFFSAPVLCGGGDEDPWDVDSPDQGGAGGVGDPGAGSDSLLVDPDGIVRGDSDGSEPGGDPIQSIITRYGYGAWIILISWMEDFSNSSQAVAGKADGGSASVK